MTMTEPEPPRSRFRPDKRAGMRLEDRDRRLLTDLFLHRAMARSQIQELYFGSVQRCNTRLRQLFDHGFVERHFSPAAPFGAQAAYLPGQQAIPVAARGAGMDIDETRKLMRRRLTPTDLERALKLVDVHLEIKRAVALLPAIEMETWVPPVLARHEYSFSDKSGGKARSEEFEPDAFLRLTQTVQSRHFNYFIELDLGYTSLERMERRFQVYREYVDSGLFQETYGVPGFTALVMTDNETRLKKLSQLARAVNAEIFRFTTFERSRAGGILRSVWHTPKQSVLVNLLVQR
jgi:hypothetical protein